MSLFASDEDIQKLTKGAIRHFWRVRTSQANRQKASGTVDAGFRSAVTGGKQFDQFLLMCSELLVKSGVPEDAIFANKKVEVPGFYRPAKKWDLLVVHNGRLLLTLEMKSHIGPSFGNNSNNRAEEALGNAEDFWRAHQDAAFGKASRPWLGILFVLEDCDKTQRPTKPKEPHYKVLPEFQEATYAQRYELLCRKLVLERKYDGAAFLLSRAGAFKTGEYSQPAPDLGIERLVRGMIAHVLGGLNE